LSKIFEIVSIMVLSVCRKWKSHVIL
jgi:hypothetical protein